MNIRSGNSIAIRSVETRLPFRKTRKPNPKLRQTFGKSESANQLLWVPSEIPTRQTDFGEAHRKCKQAAYNLSALSEKFPLKMTTKDYKSSLRIIFIIKYTIIFKQNLE